MIAQLTGTLVRMDGGSVILDVGGVGYQLFVPTSTLAALPATGEKVTLQTHLAGRVQPDFDISLYGFPDSAQLQAFKMLLSVSGVGAKVALAMLSALSLEEMTRALSTSDTKIVTKVPGVGPKLAQRICLELGDKMAALAFDQRTERAEATQQTAQENAAFEDVIEGLVSLGYGRQDSRRAADRVFATSEDRSNTGVLIAEALQLLNAGKR